MVRNLQLRGCMSRHTNTAPYHPSLNGEAERFVQTFKLALDKANPNIVCEDHSTPFAVTLI